jgi:enoyl-CoA hydratase/carnithine racemase
MAENYKGIQYETILAWVEDGIGYLQFNRPKAFNAVNYKLLIEATEALNFYSEDPDVKVIIVCGNENAFAAGADLKFVSGFNAFEARDFLD